MCKCSLILTNQWSSVNFIYNQTYLCCACLPDDKPWIYNECAFVCKCCPGPVSKCLGSAISKAVPQCQRQQWFDPGHLMREEPLWLPQDCYPKNQSKNKNNNMIPSLHSRWHEGFWKWCLMQTKWLWQPIIYATRADDAGHLYSTSIRMFFFYPFMVHVIVSSFWILKLGQTRAHASPMSSSPCIKSAMSNNAH